MPRVEIPANVSGYGPDATLSEPALSETLADNQRVGPLVAPAHGSSAAAAPARSIRRATARRASERRATARGRQADAEASIIDFLVEHPGSTAGDLARGLNLNPEGISTRLTQLAKTGEIKRASHGYSMNTPRPRAQPRPHRRSH